MVLGTVVLGACGVRCGCVRCGGGVQNKTLDINQYAPLDVSITQQGKITKVKITPYRRGNEDKKIALHSRGNEDTN